MSGDLNFEKYEPRHVDAETGGPEEERGRKRERAPSRVERSNGAAAAAAAARRAAAAAADHFGFGLPDPPCRLCASLCGPQLDLALERREKIERPAAFGCCYSGYRYCGGSH